MHPQEKDGAGSCPGWVPAGVLRVPAGVKRHAAAVMALRGLVQVAPAALAARAAEATLGGRVRGHHPGQKHASPSGCCCAAGSRTARQGAQAGAAGSVPGAAQGSASASGCPGVLLGERLKQSSRVKGSATARAWVRAAGCTWGRCRQVRAAPHGAARCVGRT